ncbi:sensor histidine kinase [Streptomyces griseoaurantiacus]|uniref:sensor histidine kinase n=1 Tax=Streptomyces griseoaurantiacus TaxID=68213 RepID=UPI0036CCA39A
MKSSSPAEWAAVRRARLRIAVITGAIITLLVTVVGGVAHTVMVRAQNDQVWREVRYSAEYGDLTSPPVCTWLYAPGVTPLANAPKGFPLRADVDRVRGDHENLDRTVRRDDTVYLVSTRYRTDGRVVQAVFDMRFQLADRDHLWFALGVAELVGLLAAVVTGAVLGRRAVAPLVEALTRQERFVTDASHELRTPITQVHTRAQVLARQAAAQEMPDPHRAGLARLADSAGRLGEVLDDLLRSARLSADPERPSERRPVDLVALARSVVAEEAERAGARRLTVVVDGPPHPLVVEGVESALRRAVGELLSNAISHTPAGGRIEVALSRAEGTVGLAVSDTGPGLDPTAVDQLFQRFHRGSSDGARYGLGLALLREVVTRHRGTVAASGRPGHGARFTIRLPEYASTALRPARPLLTVPTWRAVGPRRGRPRPAGGPVRPGGSPR